MHGVRRTRRKVSTKLPCSQRRLAHATHPAAHGCPALRPARVRLCRVLLGQRASLHSPRLGLPPPGPAFVVRLLHRYYPVVRLLAGVRVGRTALAFAHRLPLLLTDAAAGFGGFRAELAGGGSVVRTRAFGLQVFEKASVKRAPSPFRPARPKP